jgi:hypothetical protein
MLDECFATWWNPELMLLRRSRSPCATLDAEHNGTAPATPPYVFQSLPSAGERVSGGHFYT